MMFFIIGLIIVFLAYAFLIMPGKLPKNADNRLWETYYAHRGLYERDQSVPENSMVAFQKAVKAGYGIELDLNLTLDGKIVVFHDDTLLRVCGVDKLITDCTDTELSQYRLYDTDERIPLFSEVLSLVDGQVSLIVELKTTKHWKELCQKAAEALDAYKGTYCIESFNPLMVRWFYKNRPDVVRGQLSAGSKIFRGIPIWQRFVIVSLITNVMARPHFVAFYYGDAHRKPGLGLFHRLTGKLVGWTVRDEDDLEYCLERFDVIIFEFINP